MPTALVLDGGSGPALATVRSLGRGGWRVLACAGTRSAWSRHAADAFPIPDASASPERFVSGVRAVLEQLQVDVVVPCTDASAELLWANEAILGSSRVLGADRASFDLCSDKARALAAAEEAGFGVPDWLAPQTVDEAQAALERIGLPCVVKPRRSYIADGAHLRHRRHDFVRTSDELPRALKAQAEPDGTLPLIQQYVPGRSLSVSAVVQDGRILARVARETLSFEPIAGGTSVWKRTIAPDDVGVERALELLLSIRYEGLAEVEYQVDAGGRERLMEVGARAHGWVALAVAAGVDLPLIAARALLGEEVGEHLDYRVGVDMRWPAGEAARLRRALAGDELPPGVTRWDVVRRAWPPWRPGMRYDGVSLDDPAPFLPAPIRARVLRARDAR